MHAEIAQLVEQQLPKLQVSLVPDLQKRVCRTGRILLHQEFLPDLHVLNNHLYDVHAWLQT